jgi:hypothetical protein
MPRKHKPRKSVDSPEQVWIAPRPANPAKPRTFELAGTVPSNRYLDFADIVLGTKKPSLRKKKVKGKATHSPPDQTRQGKVIPINGPRTANQGFGAFRNSR